MTGLHHIPNLLTGFRIVLLIPFIWVFLLEYYQAAFVMFLIAGVSDGVDGLLARAFQWQSRLGSFLDPLADKVLLMVSFILLAYANKLELWVVILLLFRDIVIMWGAGTYYWLFYNMDFVPTVISKINTVLQVLLVFLLLYELAYYEIPYYVTYTLTIVVITTTIVSLIDYLWAWGKLAYHNWDNN